MKAKYSYWLVCALLFNCLFVLPGKGQDAGTPPGHPILLELSVDRQLRFDIEANLHQDRLYLPVRELFGFLKIKYNYNFDAERLKIFYPNQNNPFVLDLQKERTTGVEQSINWLPDQIFYNKQEIYFEASILEKLLDIEFYFDFRKLWLMLYSERKLPVVQFQERKERYKSFNGRDSISINSKNNISNKHPLLDGWVADWSLNSSHSQQTLDYTYGLGLGGQLLGGNFLLSGAGSKDYGLNQEQLNWRWEYPIYSSSFIKQLQIGHLQLKNNFAGQGAFQGLTITNSPNAPRREFDTFTIADVLPEGWDSEFYVNRVFQDYATSEKKDQFSFSNSLEYGSNLVQLKYYDQNGLHHEQQYRIFIPREFIPPGEIEYNLSAGRYSYYDNRYFSQLDLNWGISSHATLGTGALLEKVNNGIRYFPFVQSRIRLGNQTVVKASHLLNRLTKGTLRTSFSNSQMIQIDVTKHHSISVFNKTKASLDAGLSTSFPLRLGNINISTFLSSRFARSQSGSQNLSVYNGVSSRLPLGIGLYLKNSIQFRDTWTENLAQTQSTTQIDLLKRLWGKLRLRPSIEYNHIYKEVTNLKLGMRFRTSTNSYLDFSFNRNSRTSNNRFLLSFRLDLSFARHNSYMHSNTGNTSFSQTTSGSITFNDNNRSLAFDNRNQTGKATVKIHPFLDLNQNGRQDDKEPQVDGIKADFYIEGKARPTYRNRMEVKNLIPHSRYMLKINDKRLSNPLWKSKHSSYTIRAYPNRYNVIPIPIIVTGEVSGKVVIVERTASSYKLNGLEITLSSDDRDFTEIVTTYLGGEFYAVGLNPGSYTATLDEKQLEDRSLQTVNNTLNFNIEPKKQGDIVDGVTFKLNPADEKQIFGKGYYVQIGAFKYKMNAVGHVALSQIKLDHEVEIIYDPKLGLYKCRIGIFKTRKEAKQIHSFVRSKSSIYEGAFITTTPVE